ncbi:hypothetical protein DQ244_03230 [Blastococcus sp. TBT05-19]|uniref:hypothetical protein n=1 Tax=Blastococcus sp. TBT05-19 TaxID=2250581 RepID=UPI000DE839F1|nr:hypothetical protein [Blastococcus sp. TBT05-19]RBY94353.1 hypothetical protein DQ244_03230 [Blastococcus sp. TBT05-19]
MLWPFRDQAVDPAVADPCAPSSAWTPGGDQPVLSCTLVRDDRYLRRTEGWQELARSDADVRVGVMGPPGVPLTVLEEALAAARPMTDDEYATWLDEGPTPGW